MGGCGWSAGEEDSHPRCVRRLLRRGNARSNDRNDGESRASDDYFSDHVARYHGTPS
jgi:hypothetical protein